MRLRKLDLDSFRAFDTATVEFPPSGIILVAGINNSGKTALLSAIDLIATGANQGNQSNYATGRAARIRATFELSYSERQGLLDRIDELDALETAEFSRFTWQFDTIGDQLIITEVSYTLPDQSEFTIARLSLEGTTVTIQTLGDLPMMVGADDGPPDGHLVNRFSQSPGDLGALRQSGHLGPFNLVADYLARWGSDLYHFRALRPGTDSETYPGRADQRLSPSGQNLPAVINNLYHNDQATFDHLKELIQEIVPGVGELRLPLTNDRIEVSFVDSTANSLALNLKSLGTGVEQLLMTLVVGLTDEGSSGVIVEEPETNLHPGAQRALLNLIHGWSSDRLFILATHSPVFLDTSVQSEIVLVTRSAGKSTVQSLGQEALAPFQDLGVRLSDVLSADRLLLVEGKTDLAVLTTWFPHLTSHHRVAVIPTEGGDSARYAHHLQQWLTVADRLGDRRVLYLRDRDELPENELQRLERTNVVRVGSGRELENYLLDEEALVAVIRAQDPDLDVTPTDIENKLKEIASQLLQTVVLKRVCRDLAPIRLVDNALRSKLSKMGAGLQQLQEEVLRRIPDHTDMRHRIAERWHLERRRVESAWPQDWRRLAPGEELLDGLWQQYNLGRYSKLDDGPAIASAMDRPPRDLEEIIEDFLRD